VSLESDAASSRPDEKAANAGSTSTSPVDTATASLATGSSGDKSDSSAESSESCLSVRVTCPLPPCPCPPTPLLPCRSLRLPMPSLHTIQRQDWRKALLVTDEESGASSEIVVASSVTPDVFAALLSRHTLPRSTRYDAHSKEITISDLGLGRHGFPIMKFAGLAAVYSRAQGARRVPPVLDALRLCGRPQHSPWWQRRCPGRDDAATQQHRGRPRARRRGGRHRDGRAARRRRAGVLWVARSKRRGAGRAHHPRVQAPPAPTPAGAAPGPFAAVAALYERGHGPGGRLQQQVAVPGPALVVVVGPCSLSRLPPRASSASALRPSTSGECLNQLLSLGTPPTGVGFGGPACDAPGLAEYRIRVPAAVLYSASPPPAGMQLAGIPDPVNDWTIDLYDFVDALNMNRDFRAGE